MADNNNVFILFEEIKTMLEGMTNRLEALPKVIDGQQPDEDSKQDLSPIKDAVAEAAKANAERIKGLLARQWEAYSKASNTILRRIDYLEEELKIPKEQQKQPLLKQEHIHRHSFDIKSSKVFSFVVGLGVVCTFSLWGNIEQWQSKRQYADDALKFRAIRAWGGCDANDVLWLNKVFDIHRDEKAIEWVRRQADGYDTSLKAVSDSIMQEGLKGKSPTDNPKSD